MLAEALDANWPVLQFVSHGRQVDGEDPETPLGFGTHMQLLRS